MGNMEKLWEAVSPNIPLADGAGRESVSQQISCSTRDLYNHGDRRDRALDEVLKALKVWSSHFVVDKRTWVFMVSAEIQELLGDACSRLASCGEQALPGTPTSGSLPGLPVNCILNSHPLPQRGHVSPVAAEQTPLQRSAKDPRAALQGEGGMYRSGLLWFLLLVTGE